MNTKNLIYQLTVITHLELLVDEKSCQLEQSSINRWQITQETKEYSEYKDFIEMVGYFSRNPYPEMELLIQIKDITEKTK